MSPRYSLSVPEAEKISSRLTELMAQRDFSQSSLARRVGCTPAAINQIALGKTLRSKYLPDIARALGVPLPYLMGDIDDPSDWDSIARPETADSVEIAEIDLAYGMGGTYLDDGMVSENSVPFPRDWLRLFTKSSPENLFFARGRGDSMMPTIGDGDIVLIDRSQDTIRMRDELWAAALGGVGMIKRLRPNGDGSVSILSDNPNVGEDKAVDDELFVIGRVVAVVRKV